MKGVLISRAENIVYQFVDPCLKPSVQTRKRRMYFWVAVLIILALSILKIPSRPDVSRLSKFSGIDRNAWRKFRETGLTSYISSIEIPIEHQEEFRSALEEYKENNI